MSIYSDTNAVLATLDIPYYHGMPEFGENEPDTYAVYSTTGKDDFFASSENRSETSFFRRERFGGR